MALLRDATLRDLFEQEAGDQLDAIDGLLPRLGDPAATADLVRHAHTLKGSAAVMGIAPVSEVAALLEQVFELVKEAGAEPDGGVAASARAAVDDLRYVVSGLLTGLEIGTVGDDTAQALRALVARLERRTPETSLAAPAAAACDCASRIEPLLREVLATQARVLALLEPRRPGASVLVVDDSRTVRELHHAVLAAEGHEVRAAAEGGEALRLLDERPADIVVTDLDMPGMDGLRLVERLCDGSRPDRPVVLVVTSHSDAATRERLLAAGADAVLAKGVADGDRLAGTVADLLGSAR